MTNETDYREKTSAVFFAAIMVVSVFAGGIAFAGSAAADSAALGPASATDVEVNESSAVQEVTFDVDTDSTADSGNVTITATSGVANIQSVSASGSGDVTVTDSSVNSANEVELALDYGGSGTTGHTVTVTLTHDTSGVAETSGGANTYTVADAANTNSAQATYDFTDLVSSTGTVDDLTGTSPQSQTVSTITVDQTTLVSGAQSSDYFVYVNVTTLRENGIDVDSMQASATDPSTGSADVTQISSNSGVTIVEIQVTGADTSTTDSFDLELSQLDTSSASDDTGLTYDLAASTGTTSNTNYDSSDGNAPSADNTQSQSFALSQGGDKQMSSDSSSPTLVFQGQSAETAAGTFDADSSVSLRRSTDSGSEFVRELTADSNGKVVVDTTGLSSGDYLVRGELSGTTEERYFEVAVQSVDVSADSTSVANGGSDRFTDVSISSNRGGTFDHVITSENLTVSELAQITGGTPYDADSDGTNESVLLNAGDGSTFTANFTDIEAGDYTITFDVEDTTAQDSVDFTVSEVGAGEAAFADDTVVEERGDVAEITIELTEAATSGNLIIGDEDQIGYQANVSFTDKNGDGVVTIEFNSYSAGTGSMVVSSADDDVTLEKETGSVSDLLDAGDYDLRVTTQSMNDASTQPQDLSVLVLEERSTDGVKLWTASSTNAGEIATADDVTAAVDAGTLTEADTVATGDTVVHEFSATGLEGVLAAQDADSTTTAFEDALANGNLTATLNQTEESTKANTEPRSDVIDKDDVDKVIKSGDTYYVFTNSDNFDVSLAGEQVYDVSIAVNDTRLLDGDTAADQTVTDQFEVVERSGSFDTPVEAQATSEEAISGTATVAPGTELTVRVQSTGDTEPRFVKSQTVTVQEDGSWTATFDFSAQSAGDTFTTSVRNGVPTTSADGQIVEAPTPTPTETTETPTETTETPTETTTTTTTTEPTETATEAATTTTEEETPGFGAILALVAMLAAALLATRRDE